MSDEVKLDMSCVPYRRKRLYFALTIPFLALLILVFLYLWTFNFIFSVVFLAFYLATCYFQTYCCAYQECPYVGGFCPAIAGIMPASILTKLMYNGKKVVKSRKRFEIYATLASLSWLGLIILPLFWIGKLGIAPAAGYLAFHVAYYLIFGLTICPVCATRHTCPGGKLQSVVLRR